MNKFILIFLFQVILPLEGKDWFKKIQRVIKMPAQITAPLLKLPAPAELPKSKLPTKVKQTVGKVKRIFRQIKAIRF